MGIPLCAEILVDGDKSFVIRERQREEDMWENERIISAIDEEFA